MSGALAKIEPLHAQEVPPKGDDHLPSRAIGSTSKGKVIYERTIIRAAREKVPVLDGNGNQVFGKNPMTGEVTHSKWRAVPERRLQQFTLESDGAGNIYIQEYLPPTAAEIAKAERARKVEEFQRSLVEGAVDAGISVDALLSALSHPPEAPAAHLPKGFFPQHKGASNWVLSNGESFRGSKEKAVAAEAALHVEREPAVTTADGTASLGGEF